MKVAFYKGTRPGWQGLYNRLVRFIDRGPYSHVELIFSDGMSASASWMDGGVRFKKIDYEPERWDFVDLPAHLETYAYHWFLNHKGWGYDILGNLRFMFGPVREGSDKYFCSEAVAAALEIPEPWRIGPNALYSLINFMNRPEARQAFT